PFLIATNALVHTSSLGIVTPVVGIGSVLPVPATTLDPCVSAQRNPRAYGRPYPPRHDRESTARTRGSGSRPRSAPADRGYRRSARWRAVGVRPGRNRAPRPRAPERRPARPPPARPHGSPPADSPTRPPRSNPAAGDHRPANTP